MKAGKVRMSIDLDLSTGGLLAIGGMAGMILMGSALIVREAIARR